ncbi:hypothetical protein JTE90_004814 [Oedothorax gibbosus]|uniref:Uncharacterized protein n=1 Tax=Oedothorax gibbosus TaxID=931172 RepID=A0AAV6VJI9_9ARAC|nr:hypothetical protein JTE90_004814 [Oedothorax gibbosus]
MNPLTLVTCAVAVICQFISTESYKVGGGEDYNPGRMGQVGYAKPTPYQMEYIFPDAQGNAQFRHEQGDGNGNVRGSYGYRDNQGMYRTVQYVAGRDGFKANVLTNEPGTDAKENPADVVMNVLKTPAGIVEKYNRRSQKSLYSYAK